MLRKQLKLAQALEKKSQWQKAAEVYQSILSSSPSDPTALSRLATLCSRAGENRISATLFQRLSTVRKLESGELAAFGRALLGCGNKKMAAQLLQQSLLQNSMQADAWYQLGRLLAESKDFERAAGCFQRVTSLTPNDSMAAEALAQCLLKSGHYALARPVVEKLYSLDPDNSKLALAYAQLLYHTGRLQQAISQLSVIVERDSSLKPLLWLAMSYMQIGDKASFDAIESEILTFPEKLTSEQKQELKLWKSRCYMQIGEKESAISMIYEVLDAQPSNATAWQYLADAMPSGIDEGRLSMLHESIEKESDSMRLGGLYFALGCIYENCSDKTKEVEAYEKGNKAIAPQRHHYDEALRESAAELIDYFSLQQIKTLSAAGDRTFRPIFILSMPRSGTTLLEQVLGTHSGIAAAGESTVMDYVLDQRKQSLGLESRREYLKALSIDEIGLLAAEFRVMISKVAESDSPVIVEKGMNNVRDAGLLAAMFPEATFIILERHPMDVGWGCFKQNFSYQNFSYSYDGIASEFSRFFALKKHWLEHLPKKPFAVRYEDMVLDLRGTVKPIIESCGLDWEEGCLEFQQRRVAVATASMNQVRKGLYSDSLNRWKNYGDLMGPLYSALASKGVFNETDYEEPAL
ncbi:tetratricopeptide repeat-containing sulfotransferase family protein [Alcanivorax sp.]|mgnify:FL=1|uniref:tetratricopeptide repeat-containing sulfotransferase family protein n=1 Tax=Alcanivorax sp. TaxID=1872427 RepID=UPI002619282C|nr:tetratricopeptide repeat-containing sulfotransferase family protein [Alcanivorax sp.]